MRLRLRRQDRPTVAPQPLVTPAAKRKPAPTPIRPADLGDGWQVLDGVMVPGSPSVVTAAVGRRGTLVLTAIGDHSSVDFVRGKPYCGPRPLEPVVAQSLSDARAIAEILRGPLLGKPVVNAVLVAPGAPPPFSHLDVLVTSPDDLAFATLVYPEAYTGREIDATLSTLRGLTGDGVPRAWTTSAPHERSAAELHSIAARPAPPASPQPWRDWSADGVGSGRQGSRGSPAAPKGRRARRVTRRMVAALAVVGVIVGLRYVQAHSPQSFAQRLGSPGKAASSNTTVSVPKPSPTDARVHAASTAISPYPGYRPGDVIANSAGAVLLYGITATLYRPVRGTDVFGQATLCASVSLHNGSSAELTYELEDWALQSPSGDVQQPDLGDTDEDLSDGQLIQGGNVAGTLCFDDPGQAGLYVVSFQPEVGSGSSRRVVWLVEQH
jgi:hypothetical protein